jgi:hypothetical protein
MSKLAFTAVLLLLAGCGASNTTGPTNTSEPSFLNNTKGCVTAGQKTAGTPGAGKVAVACTKGQRP